MIDCITFIGDMQASELEMKENCKVENLTRRLNPGSSDIKSGNV